MHLKKIGLDLSADSFLSLETIPPLLLTPGAARALAVKICRLVRTSNQPLDQVLLSSRREYPNPVSPDVMQFQIHLAVTEASTSNLFPRFSVQQRNQRCTELPPIARLVGI